MVQKEEFIWKGIPYRITLDYTVTAGDCSLTVRDALGTFVHVAKGGRRVYDSTYNIFNPIGARIIDKFVYDTQGNVIDWYRSQFDDFGRGQHVHASIAYDGLNRPTRYLAKYWDSSSASFKNYGVLHYGYSGPSISYTYFDGMDIKSTGDSNYVQKQQVALNANGLPSQQMLLEPTSGNAWDTSSVISFYSKTSQQARSI